MSYHPHQIIVRADGLAMRAEQFVSGEKLIGPSGEVSILKIERAKVPEWVEIFFSNGVSLLVSPDHKFLCSDGTTLAARQLTLCVGISGRSSAVKVQGLVHIRGAGQGVEISTDGDSGFYVQGILNHNVAKTLEIPQN